MKTPAQQWAIAALIGAFLVLVAHQGSLLGIERSFSPSSKDLAGVAEVRDLIRRRWVEAPEPGQLLDGALKGMAATLDPFSEFISAEQLQQFEESTTGRFGGLGVWVQVEEGLVVVISPIEGTPAWEAGLLPGDKIHAVDGKPCEFSSVSEAVQQLKGEIGTSVKLDVQHKGEDRLVRLEVTRAQIQIHSVKGARLLDRELGLGYLRITAFNSATLDEVRAAVTELLGQGLRSLILDLRGNPGGFLDQAVKVANLWLPDDAVVVRTWSRERGQYKDTIADGEQPLRGIPTAVLIDGGSASASEVLGGALSDNGAATLVGTRSYGKGSVQTILSVLGNQAQLKLTTQYYFTPKNRRIHRGELGPEDKSWGLLPDLEVDVPQRERWNQARAESDREMERLKAKARGEAHEIPERLHLEDPQVRAAFTHLVEQLGAELPPAVAEAARVTSADSVAPVETNTASVAPVESEAPAEDE